MTWNWDRAIAINQAALARIVAGLIAMIGLAGGIIPERLPRALHAAALRVLRPAESATRRLIVIAARGVSADARPPRPAPQGLAGYSANKPRVTFQLFDPRKRFDFLHLAPRATGPRPAPRILVFGGSPLAPMYQPRLEPYPSRKSDDGMVAAACLGRRLTALKDALDNLSVQAKRLKRWQARRNRMTGFIFREPLRPGRPPGYRKKPRDEVDRVLRECHALAWDALNNDSS